MEIQEAYEVLSVPAARQTYDRERRLAGLDQKQELLISPQSILHQAQKLSEDIRRMTAYRIDIYWLKSALVYLLSMRHLAVLLQSENEEIRLAFLKEIIHSMRTLKFPFPDEITKSVSFLVAKEKEGKAEWETFLADQRKKYKWRKTVPWIAVVATVVLCYLMYWYGKS